MIPKKLFPIAVFFVLMLWGFNYSNAYAEQEKTTPEKQIQISNFKFFSASSSNCEVEVSFLATYKNFKTGKEPEM